LDEEQLKSYLEIIHNSETNQKDEIINLIQGQIFQSNGSQYKISNIKQVLSNLEHIGFVASESSTIRLDDLIIRSFNNNDWELSDLFLAILMSKKFGKNGEKTINDPYIIDLLYDFMTIFHEYPNTDFSTREILNHSSSNGSEFSNPIRGYSYDSLTSEGASRAVLEGVKLLVWLGAVTKINKKYKLNEDLEHVNLIRKRLGDLRFENWLNLIVKNLGSDHNLMIDEKHDLVGTASKYVIYRYSGGLGKHRNLQEKVLKNIKYIHGNILESYKSETKGKTVTFDTILKLITRRKNLICQNLSEKHNSYDFKGKGITLSKWELIEKSEPELQIELYESEKTGHKFTRTLVESLRHDGETYSFPSNFKLHRWQEEATLAWVKNDYNGLINAVTGSGKTVTAIECYRQFKLKYPNCLVNVIVPTRVLLHQWAEEFAKLLNLGVDEIGLSGDGFSDSHTSGKTVMIRVVNSAVNENSMVNDLKQKSDVPVLIIADECHMYGGSQRKKFLNIKSVGFLAISATPPTETKEGNKHPVILRTGDPIYELNYRRAYENQLISKFHLNHIGVDLVTNERMQYERYSKEMIRCMRDIENHHPDAFNKANFIAYLQTLMKDGKASSVVSKYLELMRLRHDIVKKCVNRDVASNLVLNKLRDGTDVKNMMIFSERIEEIRNLAVVDQGRWRLEDLKRAKEFGNEGFEKAIVAQHSGLRKVNDEIMDSASIKVGMYHSQFPGKWGKWMVEWYRLGRLNLMLSAQALAQGFDVPGAEYGLIRSSSGNVRQRIQTIGRLLRKKDETSATIWIIFVKNTSEERIYREFDWVNDLPEYEDVETYWEIENGSLQQKDFKDMPRYGRDLNEDELQNIDCTSIKIGDLYPEERILRHVVKEFYVNEENIAEFIEMGATFKMIEANFLNIAHTISENGFKRRFYFCENGHLVGKNQIREVVFLGQMESIELENLMRKSKEDADKSFFDGWN